MDGDFVNYIFASRGDFDMKNSHSNDDNLLRLCGIDVKINKTVNFPFDDFAFSLFIFIC